MKNWLGAAVFVGVAIPCVAYRLLFSTTLVEHGITAHPAFQDFTRCVIRPGEQFLSVVQFRNTTKASIAIHAVVAGCGCATVTPERSLPAVLLQGEVINCAVRINPLTAEVDQQLHVTASWDNLLSEGLHKETFATICFRVVPRLTSLPQVVSFGRTAVGATVEEKITLFVDSREPISPDVLSFDGPDGVTFEFAPTLATIPAMNETHVELGQLTIRFTPTTADVPLSKSLVVSANHSTVCEIALFGYPSIRPTPDTISK